jgi:hypothetical protein
MTNWSGQTLEISGEKDNLAPFANKLFSSWHFSKRFPAEVFYELLRTFFPIPDDIYHGDLSADDFESLVLKGQGPGGIDGYIPPYAKEPLDASKKKDGEKYWSSMLWRRDYWGSPWGDEHTIIHEHDDTHIKMSFNSEVFPSLGGILSLSNLYPLLVFAVNYGDGGISPDGGVVFMAGKILSHWQQSEEEFMKEYYSTEQFGGSYETKS